MNHINGLTHRKFKGNFLVLGSRKAPSGMESLMQELKEGKASKSRNRVERVFQMQSAYLVEVAWWEYEQEGLCVTRFSPHSG